MRIRRAARLALCLMALAAMGEGATPRQPSATVREYKKVLRTYPYSDPDPIAAPGRIYPYFRFDGYTDRAVDREWTVVELENDYVRVAVLPEIGGKIWSAVEKSTGRGFIYENHVVKFRDIALRGPWTSGGIEPNYGIIGHTPNCATPVDYVTRTDADGTARVVIGVLDLLTRTPWRLEISLPPDKAYFTTRSFWYNATPLEQPYYSWMNAGIKAAGQLQLVYPGTHHLGHGGEAASWPRDASSGRDLSFYEQNDFGPYKSYHVFGRYSEFFGAYWHQDDFGMGRYSLRDDKLGKKAWIWGLSRQGMIWERLLTDTDGQYVEVQSGRLFNQAAESSTATPFKHRGFAPYSADTWTEYWFPVKGTKGFVIANDVAALNVRHGDGEIEIAVSPLAAIDDTLEVRDGDRVLLAARLALRPMETWTHRVKAVVPPDRLRVQLGGNRLEYGGSDADRLSRPVESPRDFDWDSAYGLHLKGKEWMRQREYVRARADLEASLRQDANYLPALTDLAMVRLRAMDAQGAWDLTRRALSIDTYDPAANYYYGLASRRLGRTVDAKDGFEVAASSPEYRVAAWIELSKLLLSEGRLLRADEYAAKALDVNRHAVDAWQIRAVVARLGGAPARAEAHLAQLIAMDPLNHLARFERHLLAGDERSRLEFVSGIRQELPHETFLELAAWYRGVGRVADAQRILLLAPPSAEVLYWLAFVQSERGDPAAAATLRAAEAASPALVFPFRPESVLPLQWAIRQTGSWRPKYYLALVHWGLDDLPRARQLLEECGATPDYAPFYASRARALDGVSRERSLADLRRAAALDPSGWRYGRLLVERYLEDKATDEAIQTAARYLQSSPGHYILGMLYARSLLLAGRYAEADVTLRGLRVLPYEGATEGRALYREAQLMLALQELKAGRPAAALQRVSAGREWPENLGAGKPYPEDVDERLEDWIDLQVLERQGRSTAARAILDRVTGPAAARPGFGRLPAALALARAGRHAEAERLLDDWTEAAGHPALAAWGRAVFKGDRAPLPDLPGITADHRILAAWQLER